MHFATKDLDHASAYRLLTGTILPRPIAFVTSVSADGVINGAPFSFFNAMGSAPPVIVLGFELNTDGSQKDTPNNILATGEFVVNLVDEPLAAQMNIAAGAMAPDVDELSVAGLASLPSIEVRAPRITAAPVSMECKALDYTVLKGGGRIIMGEVLHFHVRDDIVTCREPLRISIDKLAPIGRLNGSLYSRITNTFELARPSPNSKD